MKALILAVMAVGALGAFALLARPVLLLWFTTLFSLVIGGTVGYFIPSAKMLVWVSYGAGLLMFVYAFTQRSQVRISCQGDGLLLASLATFLFVCALSSAFALSPVMQLVVALKSLVFFAGMWVFFMQVPISDKVMSRWLMLICGIALGQWVIALYQYIFVRNYRIASGLGTVEASDSVVGTFGGSMESGGLTAVLAFFLVLMIIAFSALRSENILKGKMFYLALGLTTFPLLIMEVKIIFFYLPVALFVLHRKQLLANPLKLIAFGGGGALMLAALLFTYQKLHWSSGGNDPQDAEAIFAYSFEAKSGYFAEQEGVLTRMGSLLYWWQEHADGDFLHMAIGHGLGSSRTVGRALGAMGKEHSPKNIDRTALALFLWDVGIVGFAAILGILYSMFRITAYLTEYATPGTWKRALARTLNVAMPLFALSLVYRNDIPYAAPMMFIIFTAFGCTAWLRRSFYYEKIGAKEVEVAPLLNEAPVKRRRGLLIDREAV